MHEYDNHFGSYNHLAHLPRGEEALFILRKAASCAKPLMRKRGWRVGVLSEFLPEQPNLLGLNTNRGEHIQLRLRYPSDYNQFLPFEQVLDTLLHELCHNVWGPHDENFHRLWNELRDDWETLQLKGFSGEGFLGKGQALGGNRIPVEEVRRRARAAAQERAKLNKNKYDPGHRLGGAGNTAPPQSRRRLRDLLANAAQSRNKASTVKVDSGCATGTQVGNKAAEDALRNGFRTKDEMDDANSIAIAQALQQLYEQEEDDRILDGLAGPPATGGLTWDPELGLQAVSAPVSRSTTPLPAATNGQLPPRTSSRPAQTRPESGRTDARPTSLVEINPHGRPVSRLVLEAEAQQQRSRPREPREPPAPTPAVQYWPSSETGANFSGPPSSWSRPFSAGSDDGSMWECPQCTFHNHGSMTKCEICDAPKVHAATKSAAQRKPAPQAEYASTNGASSSQALDWNCSFCGTFMENTWWTCSQCGLMKDRS